jgi:hypothetical protein
VVAGAGRVLALAGTVGVLAGGAAWAQAPGGAGRAPLGVKGHLTYRGDAYFDTAPNDDQTLRHEGILQLEWERRVDPWGAFRLIGEGRADDAGDARGVHFRVPDTADRRSHLGVKEATASVRWDPVELTVGKQIFAWGTADAFNPTDNLNPYDYMEVLDNEKMGIYSVAGRLGFDPATLTVVAVPVFTPSRLPRRDSRWTPVPPAGVAAVVDPREIPPADVDNVQYGARLKATLAGWDLSTSYYRGFEHTPAFRVGTAETAPGESVARFTPVFTAMDVAGFDVSTTLGGFEVHGEGAFKVVRRDGASDRFQGMAGFNYTWDGLGHRWLDEIVLVVEYGREIELRRRPEFAIADRGTAPLVGDLLANNAFENGLIGRVRLKLTEDTQARLTGVVDFDRALSGYARLEVAHRFTDAVQLETGLDVLAGPPTSFWGRWRDNDRLFVTLRYWF